MIYYVIYTDKGLGRFNGRTYGPIITIRPTSKGDLGLIEHEKVHVRQFWSNPLFGLWYKFSQKSRLKYEVEAYKVQLTYRPEMLKQYAVFLATRYGIDISVKEAVEALNGE